MTTNGASSTSRRSVGGVRQENSESSSVPCVVYVGGLTNGVALRCFYGVYAIMYMSMTVSNPNSLFLGCPFYKGKQLQCKFFIWVDEHLAKIGSSGCSSNKRHFGEKDINVAEEKLGLEHRMTVFEKKTIALEKKKNPLAWCFVLIVCVICVALYVCSA